MSVIVPVARALARLHRRERGQTLVMFIGISVVFFAIAAIAIDGSLWQSQRRTAQKDSDASAFAAGYDLLHRQYPASQTTAANIQSAAQASAAEWVTRNGIDPSGYFTNGSPLVPLTTKTSGCFGAGPYDWPNPDSVTVDLQKQGTSFFTSIFGLLGANVGAHAKVCVGSPADASGLLPFAIQILSSPCFDNSDPTAPKPLFGQTCKVEVRPPQGQSGETGTLRLFNDGSTLCSSSTAGGQNNQNLEQNVANGANTTCEVAPTGVSASQCPMLNLPDAGIGKCVWSDTGNRAGTVLQGLQDRLAKEGQSTPPYNCDALYPDTWFNTNNVNAQNGPPNYNNDHVDQWWEALNVVDGDDHSVVPGPGVTFNKRSCTSPRIVTLVLIDQFAAQGQGPYPIRGFAAFYINGCEDTNGVFNSRCVTGNCKIGQGNNPCPNPKNEPTLQNNGQVMMDGRFINYVDVGSHGGPLNQFGRIQLFLVE